MKRDDLASHICFLEEETTIDGELGNPAFAYLQELHAALRELSAATVPLPAMHERVASHYARAVKEVPKPIRDRPRRFYISALLTMAGEYLRDNSR